MVVLNVLGFKDSFTGLYVCYCPDSNDFGAGRNRREALHFLEENMEETIDSSLGNRVFLIGNRPSRKYIERMIGKLLQSSGKPTSVHEVKSGRTLHFYHFHKPNVDSFYEHGWQERECEEMDEIQDFLQRDYDRLNGEIPTVSEDDIPF